MRIGFINGGISISETFIYNLIKGITAENNDTIFYCVNKPAYTDGINYTTIPYTSHPKGLYAKVLHTLGQRGKNFLWNRQQNLLNKKLYPAIADRDIIFIDYGTTAVRALPLLEKINKPFIVHFHGYDITSALNDSRYKASLNLIFEKASYLIAASHHIRKLLVLAGANNRKIRVVRIGIDPIKVQKKVWQQRLSSPVKRIIFIGRLTPKKHPVALIRAFHLVYNENSKVHLDIVGNGPLMKTCKELVERLNLNRSVTFHGSQPHDKAISLLENAWLYAQHSVTANDDQEGFAISLAEAALYELPVVSTFHNGIPENVIDGETGFLVKEFDFEGMAEKMLILLNDGDLAKAMGRKGKKHISSLCNPNVRIRKVFELMQNL